MADKINVMDHMGICIGRFYGNPELDSANVLHIIDEGGDPIAMFQASRWASWFRVKTQSVDDADSKEATDG